MANANSVVIVTLTVPLDDLLQGRSAILAPSSAIKYFPSLQHRTSAFQSSLGPGNSGLRAHTSKMPPPPPAEHTTNGHSPLAALQDAVYGTRTHTAGAKYQLPRKVPLRIEPKTFFGG